MSKGPSTGALAGGQFDEQSPAKGSDEIKGTLQVKTPGSTNWSPWQTGVTTLTAMYTPTQTGTYQFRALLRNSLLSKASGFSSPGKVVITKASASRVVAEPGATSVEGEGG